jgi:ParB/RepB/Spo0J family partition protein
MSLKEFDAGSGNALQESSGANDAPTVAAIARVSLDLLVPSPYNRKTFDAGKLQELADSITSNGVIQPILARPLPADLLEASAFASIAGQELLQGWKHRQKKVPRPAYEIVYGERRWRASILAQQDSIPVIVRPLEDAQVLEIQLTENLQRDDLHPLDEAEGYQRLFQITGMKKEDLGAKIGKSRTYVYQRLHLLTLGPESRTAFREGKIDYSKARLLASVADPKQQLKALKEATTEEYGGETMSVRDFRSWLERNVMLELEHAPFDIKDLSLVDGAGACAECPKRTGANRDIFEAFESADMCTDAKCYGQKASVTLQRIKDAAAEKGMKVIAGVEAKKLKPYQYGDQIRGYTRMDEKVAGGETVAKALGKDAPTPILFVDPHTRKQIKVLPSDVVGELLKEKGIKAATSSSGGDNKKWEAQRRKQELERRIREETRARAAREIMAKVVMGAVPGFSAPLLRVLLTDQLEYAQDFSAATEHALLAMWLLPEPGPNDDGYLFNTLRQHVAAAPDEELAPMLLALLLARDIDGLRSHYSARTDEPGYVDVLAEEVDVDVDEIEREVKAEIKAEEVEKRNVAKAPRATTGAAQAGAESEENPPAKARGRGGKKISAEAAKQGIADAMQDLEEPGEE